MNETEIWKSRSKNFLTLFCSQYGCSFSGWGYAGSQTEDILYSHNSKIISTSSHLLTSSYNQTDYHF